MNVEVKGKIWYWRGPSPFHFVTIPQKQSEEIKEVSGHLSKTLVRQRESLEIGDVTKVQLDFIVH